MNATPPSVNLTKPRISIIDVARGLIMIIMTLDHVRDFLMIPGAAPLDIQATTPLLFFTRWITHFCAPTFLFLSGISAFLAGQKRSLPELSLFLLTRGFWLILSDMIIISLIFTFDPGYHVLVLEVLWAIGAGMVILSALVWLPVPVVMLIGLLILFGHDLAGYLTIKSPLITLLFTARASVFSLGSMRSIVELYAVLPWSAVLFLGYGFGKVYTDKINALRRRKLLLWMGITLCLMFVALRFVNRYGDPAAWQVQVDTIHTLLAFLNTSKQPPSLLYLAMTLGPLLLLLSFAERSSGRFSAICKVYGSVPYFYFMLHLITIRIINVLLVWIEGFPFKFNGHPLVWQAEGFGFRLGTIYLIWVFVLVLLYFPCKWYGNYKQTHNYSWLSYI